MLVAGVMGAVVLPVAGLTVGTVQMVRGVANTPEAVAEARKGRVWDQVRQGGPATLLPVVKPGRLCDSGWGPALIGLCHYLGSAGVYACAICDAVL
jgi:hypothetical protein